MNYKNKKVSQDKINLLNSLNFDWDPFETDWQNKFTELKQFEKKHGHQSPSRNNKEFRPLEAWCTRQRCKHKKGKLSSEKFDLLESIGFRWI